MYPTLHENDFDDVLKRKKCKKWWFTLFEIFIFCLFKNSTLISWKNVDFFFVWKTCENVVVLDFLGVDKFDFTRKIVKKNWVKNSWKCWGLVKIEFLDENLTFRICNFPYFLTDKQKTKKSAGNSNYPNLIVSITVSYIFCTLVAKGDFFDDFQILLCAVMVIEDPC